MSQPYKYFAFISYSRKDSKVAAWLQKRLEWFRFPVKLVTEDRRPPNPKFVRPVYRDKTNLEVTDEHYWTNIRRALEESRFLIILCSEHAAKSQPVNMEVQHFLATHDGDASLLAPVIVNGNVTSEGDDSALCPTLRTVRDPDSKPLIDRNLPTIVPDATEQDAWEAGFVSLVSYLLQLERTALGDHIQRETKRQARVLRRWLAVVILLTLCAIAGGVYSLIQKREADRQTEEVARQKQEVQRQKDSQDALLLSASYADHEAAIKAFDEHREAEGIAYFERALRYKSTNSGALAAAAQHAVGVNAPRWRTRSVATFGEKVTCIAFSPDGRYLAAGSGRRDTKGEARVIEVKSGKEISKAVFGYYVSNMSFSPDGRFLAVGCGSVWTEGEAQVIDVATGKQVSRVAPESGENSVKFSPTGSYLVVGSLDAVRIIDPSSGKGVSKAEFEAGVNEVSFSPDGSRLAVRSANDILVIDAATGKEDSKAKFAALVKSMSFSPNGYYLAAGSADGVVRVVESATGREISTAEFRADVWTVNFSPDGRYFAVGSKDKTARIIEAATGKEISKAEFGDNVTCVSFSPDGHFLAVGSADKSARVLEATTGKEISQAKFGDYVSCVSFSPDGRFLAVGSGDKTARVFEAATSKEISRPELGGGLISASHYSDQRKLPSGYTRYLGGYTRRLMGEFYALQVSMDSVKSLSFSTDGRFVAAGSGDKPMRVFEVATGKEISKTELRTEMNSESFSRNGSFLALGLGGKTARVIEAGTGKEISKTEFGAEVTSVSFSPNGRFLAVASADMTMRVIEGKWGWGETDDGPSNAFMQALRHTAGIQFQPDGQLAYLTAEQLTQAQAEITAFLQAPAPPKAKWQHAILTWAAMMPEKRTTSPWTTEPLRVAAGRWFMQASGTVASFITDTADGAPWHPLEPISLARLEPKPDDKADAASRETLLIRPRFLARLTLQRLREADETLYGRATLAEYATWCAKILRAELHFEAEAQEALELKAKLEAK